MMLASELSGACAKLGRWARDEARVKPNARVATKRILIDSEMRDKEVGSGSVPVYIHH